MTELVTFLAIFIAIGIGFLFINLMVGKLIRPDRPSPEKGEIYECGEEAVGSPWIQFDLRFYVVALLFVIFDVEMAFFFPWATIFGTSNQLADPQISEVRRLELQNSLVEPSQKKMALPAIPDEAKLAETTQAAKRLAWLAFFDILVFFGVLLIGFAYLWKRGDLDWVRSTAAQNMAPSPLLASTLFEQENATPPQTPILAEATK